MYETAPRKNFPVLGGYSDYFSCCQYLPLHPNTPIMLMNWNWLKVMLKMPREASGLRDVKILKRRDVSSRKITGKTPKPKSTICPIAITTIKLPSI